MQRRNLGCKRKSGEKQKEWIWNAKQLTQETEKRIRARGKRGDCRIIKRSKLNALPTYEKRVASVCPYNDLLISKQHIISR